VRRVLCKVLGDGAGDDRQLLGSYKHSSVVAARASALFPVPLGSEAWLQGAGIDSTGGGRTGSWSNTLFHTVDWGSYLSRAVDLGEMTGREIGYRAV
jgi:hypothetical protein